MERKREDCAEGLGSGKAVRRLVFSSELPVTPGDLPEVSRGSVDINHDGDKLSR